MRRPPATASRVARLLTLPLIVIGSALLASLLHRAGHTQGDDFALYLRQARSIFDGDIGQVVADNRFSVLNSDGTFSPIAYPWVWPLLLSPFVHLWGFDYDRLKLLQVATYCLWLVLLHGIVRRRIGWWPAVAITAVFATAPLFLAHTDQLLSEFPHLAATGVVIWWYDRVRRDATLLTATTGQLIVLGSLVTVAFNVRRESMVLLGVIAAMAVYDILHDAAANRRRGQRLVDVGLETVQHRWRTLLTPFAAFAATAVLAQLLLPTDLLPDNGNSWTFIDDRFGEYAAILSAQLGFGENSVAGVIVLAVAACGVVIGVRRRPTLDGPLVMLAISTAFVIGTHIRQVDRYWFQVTPWVAYFATVALLAVAGWVLAHRPRLVIAVALAPLVVLVAAHLVVLRGDIADVRSYNDAGRVQIGPANPTVAPIYAAVNTLTPPDAVVAHFRARTMTLLTDRRSFQTSNFDRVAERADYYAERRNSTYWQPELDAIAARRAGFEQVWSDQLWILWRITDEP
jgi:hypothetical protein